MAIHDLAEDVAQIRVRHLLILVQVVPQHCPADSQVAVVEWVVARVSLSLRKCGSIISRQCYSRKIALSHVSCCDCCLKTQKRTYFPILPTSPCSFYVDLLTIAQREQKCASIYSSVLRRAWGPNRLRPTMREWKKHNANKTPLYSFWRTHSSMSSGVNFEYARRKLLFRSDLSDP